MVLRVRALKAGQEHYYLRLTRYYLDGKGEPRGVWTGTARFFFGLFGFVTDKDLVDLMKGFRPKPPPGAGGEALVQNAGSETRCGCYDLTYSSPKDLSIFIAGADKELSEKAEAIHAEANQVLLNLVEDRYAWSRTGKAGSGTPVSVDLTIAKFQHHLSREGDEQIHTHNLVANVGVDEFGNTRAVDGTPFFNLQKYLSAYARAHEAYCLRVELGIKTKAHGDAYRIEGIRDEMREYKSKRREQIKARMEALGLFGAEEADKIALETRRKKEVVELPKFWEEVKEENRELFGVTEKSFRKLQRRPWKAKRGARKQIVKMALVQLLSQKQFFTEVEFRTRVLVNATHFQIDPAKAEEQSSKWLASKRAIELEPDEKHFRRFTTKKAIEREAKLVRVADKLHSRTGIQIADEHIEATLTQMKEMGHELSVEQEVGLRHACQAKSAIRNVTGFAGVGKTRIQVATEIAFSLQCGKGALAFATPSHKAKNVLREDGLKVETLHRELLDYPKEKQLSRVAKRAFLGTKNFVKWNVIRGVNVYKRPKFKYKPPSKVKLNRNRALVVDEFGMVGLGQMTKAFEHVNDSHSTVILFGDDLQLENPVEASPANFLIRRYGHKHISEIRRQREPWYLQVTKSIAEGENGHALYILHKHGKLNAHPTMDDALAQACVAWSRTGNFSPEDSAVIVQTNAEVHEANRLCQELRLKAGALRGKGTLIVHTDKETGEKTEAFVRKWDRVIVTKNSLGRDGYGVSNGSVGTVVSLNADDTITVRFDLGEDGKPFTKTIKPYKFPHLRLAYASTAHSFQGGTINEVHAVIGSAYTDYSLWYVKATRGVLDLNVYSTEELLTCGTKDKWEAPKILSYLNEMPEKRLAMELVPDANEKLREVAKQQKEAELAASENKVTVMEFLDDVQDELFSLAKRKSELHHEELRQPETVTTSLEKALASVSAASKNERLGKLEQFEEGLLSLARRLNLELQNQHNVGAAIRNASLDNLALAAFPELKTARDNASSDEFLRQAKANTEEIEKLRSIVLGFIRQTRKELADTNEELLEAQRDRFEAVLNDAFQNGNTPEPSAVDALGVEEREIYWKWLKEHFSEGVLSERDFDHFGRLTTSKEVRAFTADLHAKFRSSRLTDLPDPGTLSTPWQNVFFAWCSKYVAEGVFDEGAFLKRRELTLSATAKELLTSFDAEIPRVFARNAIRNSMPAPLQVKLPSDHVCWKELLASWKEQKANEGVLDTRTDQALGTLVFTDEVAFAHDLATFGGLGYAVQISHDIGSLTEILDQLLERHEGTSWIHELVESVIEGGIIRGELSKEAWEERGALRFSDKVFLYHCKKEWQRREEEAKELQELEERRRTREALTGPSPSPLPVNPVPTPPQETWAYEIPPAFRSDVPPLYAPAVTPPVTTIDQNYAGAAGSAAHAMQVAPTPKPPPSYFQPQTPKPKEQQLTHTVRVERNQQAW